MTIIASYTSVVVGSLDFSNLVIKSIVTSSQGVSGTGANCIFPYGLCLADLFYWQLIHSLMYCITCCLSPGALQFLAISSMVLATPGCPCCGSSW